MWSKFLSWMRGLPALAWVGFVALVFIGATLASTKGCVDARNQRDAAYEVANRQLDLSHALSTLRDTHDAEQRRLEAEARAQDERDQREVEDLYERGNLEGSASGVLNDLIRAGELP